MKKRSLVLLTYGLAISLALFNCKKDKEDEFPKTPNPQLVDNLNKIEVQQVTLTEPATVEVVAGSIETTAETMAFFTGVGSMGSGEVPAIVTSVGEELTTTLTPADLAVVEGVTPEAIASIRSGGAVSPALQAVINKLAANPALAVYLPKLTLPKVGGVSIARIGSVEEVELTEEASAIEVDDACVQASNTAYEARLAVLTNQRDQQLAGATTAYNNAIGGLAADETSCKAGIPATYDAYRQSAQTQASQAMADLAAAESILGSNYPYLVALINLQLVAYLESINDLQKAAENACTATTAAKTAAAQAARDANNTAVNAAFTTARDLAQAARTQMAESCHNQGASW
jgi:hypothetical protein